MFVDFCWCFVDLWTSIPRSYANCAFHIYGAVPFVILNRNYRRRPPSPHGAKRVIQARKKTFFSWTGSVCVRSPHRFQQTWCHLSENPTVALKYSKTWVNKQNHRKFWKSAENTEVQFFPKIDRRPCLGNFTWFLILMWGEGGRLWTPNKRLTAIYHFEMILTWF